MAGKVCVVLGVGPGTGMSCVRKWAKEGFKVAMVSRTESKLKELAAKNPGKHISSLSKCERRVSMPSSFVDLLP